MNIQNWTISWKHLQFFCILVLIVAHLQIFACVWFIYMNPVQAGHRRNGRQILYGFHPTQLDFSWRLRKKMDQKKGKLKKGSEVRVDHGHRLTISSVRRIENNRSVIWFVSPEEAIIKVHPGELWGWLRLLFDVEKNHLKVTLSLIHWTKIGRIQFTMSPCECFPW